MKELKKLKHKGTATLDATNATLSFQIADLKVELALKDEEIRQLKKQQMESLEQIREVTADLGDVLNKARLFDNDIKAEGQISGMKIIPILVNFGCKMETTLGEMQKLFFRSQAEEECQEEDKGTFPRVRGRRGVNCQRHKKFQWQTGI